MSTIFGIFNRDSKPVSAKIIQKMLDAMSYWKPDESGNWCMGPVALGHAMLWNTPESRLEHLPAKQDHLVITMDARLDNREELAGLLEMTDHPIQQTTDSEFILAAYRRWGKKCPKYLLGDFAFAIWDEKKQQLFCARDHMGIKPFYFYLSDRLFVFANDLKGLIVHPDISEDINDEAVANYLVHSLLISTTITFFKEIQKVPPAHTLTITAAAVRKQCYWRPEQAPAVKLPDAQAYADKLRKLLKQAVHARMRSAYPITSHLSGGLDSSTIAVIAARKLREKDEKLLAFNWLHDPAENDDPAHYEWSNSKTIAEAEEIDHHYVPITADDIYRFMRNHTIAYGDTAGFWYEYPVRKAAQQMDSRTILTGWGGDELSTYHGLAYYANMVKEGKLPTLLSEIGKITHKSDKRVKAFVSFFYHHVVLPFVPRRFYCNMPKNRCVEKSTFLFIKKNFLPVVNNEKKKPSDLSMQPQTTIRAHMLTYLRHGHLQGRTESWAASAISNRLEYSYPLLDKRIIEFVLGVPPKYFVHNGIGRYLIRAAAEGLLPEKRQWANEKKEVHRVDRLLSISYSAYKILIKDMRKWNVNSNYADFTKLEEALQLPPGEDEMIQVVSETGKILSVMQCEKRFQDHL